MAILKDFSALIIVVFTNRSNGILDGNFGLNRHAVNPALSLANKRLGFHAAKDVFRANQAENLVFLANRFMSNFGKN